MKDIRDKKKIISEVTKWDLLNIISTKHCALSAKMYTRVHAILLKMQFALNALAKLNQQY